MQWANVGGANANWLDDGGVADGWYRGPPGTFHFYPRGRDRAKERDIDNIVEYVVRGWEPGQTILRKGDLVTAFGSCFAAHIESYLREAGFSTSIGRYGQPGVDNYYSRSLIIKSADGFVNTFSLRTQFEWIFDDTIPPLHIWEKSEGVINEYLDANRDAAAKIFNDTQIFIITLGLSEVWFDKLSGNVLWSGVPGYHFDPARYGFRVSTVMENLDNLRRIVDLVRDHRGGVPIVFTLSPVPLNATFRNTSCITANSVSKAILRVAVDELMRERDTDPNLYYFPAYEIVTSYLENPWETDLVHPTPETVELIMSTFVRLYARDRTSKCRKKIKLVIDGYRDSQYNVIEMEGVFYAIYRGEGYIDPIRLTEGRFLYPVYWANSVEAVLDKLECASPQSPG